MKYFIKTYGCQMNKSDSERIAAVFELAGYKKTSQESDADLIVINACSVRQSAVDRIFGNVKKYNKYRKNNPNFKVVITGCILENDKKKFEKLFDFVIDIKEIEKLPLLCHSEFISESVIDFKKNNTMQDNHKVSETKTRQSVNQGKISELNSGQALKQVQDDKVDYFKIPPQHQSKFTAYVPIMTGCDNFCAYCVVPYTRGREYSRPANEILSEVELLISKGYKEIVLLGQNVNSYKSQIPNLSPRDIGDHKSQTNHKSQIQNQRSILSFLQKQESIATLNVFTSNNPCNKSRPTNWIPASAGMTETVDFSKLLKLINSISGNFWIQFLTSHPKDMTEELIKTVARCDKCAEYIHLALQSGDNEILKKMNRKYTAEYFLSLARLIRKYIPDAAITTDIIVGFPGETEKQFQRTAKIMKKAKFDMAYINKYSPRSGTVASKLIDDISWQEKRRREKVLTEILKKTALDNNKKYIGKTVDALMYESGIKNSELGIIYGKTRSFKNVKITVGSIVPSGLRSQNAERNKPQSANAKELRSPEAGTMEPTDHSSNLVGKFIKVKITKADVWGLEGKLVE